MNLYTDNDERACAWMRELVKGGHISAGKVFCRDIAEITDDELAPYNRVHLFAGIGAWDYALALAGWPADRPVWTGSCPCQPFSAAGKRKGNADARHLWPVMRGLIDKRRPATVFGEQVASRLGREWLAGVRADLEAMGYRVGAADLCAPGVGAPHIRQRLFWVADAERTGVWAGGRGQDAGAASAVQGENGQRKWVRVDAWAASQAGGVGLATGDGPQGIGAAGAATGATLGARAAGGLPDATGVLGQGGEHQPERGEEGRGADRRHSPWSEYVIVPCGDGKARRIEPGLSPLVDGAPARVVRLRGCGNAIVAEVAARFVRAFLEAEGDVAA